MKLFFAENCKKSEYRVLVKIVVRKIFVLAAVRMEFVRR